MLLYISAVTNETPKSTTDRSKILKEAEVLADAPRSTADKPGDVDNSKSLVTILSVSLVGVLIVCGTVIAVLAVLMVSRRNRNSEYDLILKTQCALVMRR